MPYQSKTCAASCKTCFIGLLLLFCYSQNIAQTISLKDDLLKLQTSADSSIKKYPAEKLYMQFDKPYYAVGDTAWFKVYLFNAPSHLLSAKSGLLYIDLTSDSGKLVKQYVLPVKNGISWGNILLNDKIFKPGNYTLRAYTNWMRNFSADGFYYKHLTIYGTDENNWLVNSEVNTSKKATGQNQVNALLKFTDINKVPMAGKSIQLQVVTGTKSLYKQKVQTDQNGLLNVNFLLPDKSLSPAIIAESEQKDQKAVIPLNLNRAEKADLQFFPEGGDLVADLPTNIGFKAIGEDGKGVEVFGIVTDHNQQQVAAFNSLHNGMGKFSLAVKDGEVYTAKVTLPGGVVKEYTMPATKKLGTVLQLKNAMESDSVELSIAATDDIARSANSYFLIGKARGIVCYAAILNFHDGNSIRRKIAKSLFPSGIAHFILTTSNGQPLNERITFINHEDNLHIDLSQDKSEYVSRDSIALKIKVTDNAGQPVAGNFSLAVTDDALIKTDTLNDENILTRLLLTSDLKGYVEEPGYYFQQKANAWQALDNLLLTQGWLSYEPILPNQPFEAEHEFTVKGKVINVFGKPVAGSKLILFSKSPSILMDTITNSEGKFVFDRFPKVDTPVFVIKAVNKRGRSFNIGINVDEKSTPVFSAPKTPVTMPWYVNSDSTLMNYVNDKIAINKQQEYTPDGKRKLKEVVISARKTIKDSQNLNGSGNADQVIDERELEEAGKKTFLQLFEEKIKGFREGYYRTGPSWGASRPIHLSIFDFESAIRGAPESEWYFIKDRPIILIMDGTDIEDIYQPFTFIDFMDYLKSHSAEDIKGIEVNESKKYAANYLRRGKWLEAPLELPAYRDFAFVEITTRSGNSAVIRNTPGIYLDKPLPLSWPKQFYKPRYAARDTARHQLDLRSTIDWEPNVYTGKDDTALVSFYAADNPTVYTVRIEGTDMNGNVGFKRYRIWINKRKENIKSK